VLKLRDRFIVLEAGKSALASLSGARCFSAGPNRLRARHLAESELLAAFCRLAVEEGGYQLAWVGYPQQDEARSVRPVAEFGFDEGYLAQLKVSWADDEWGRGPTGRALRTGQVQATQNIQQDPAFAVWRALAVRHGYASSAALPLVVPGEVLGSLNLYAPEADAFDVRELELLQELSSDLVQGILGARGRERLSALEATLHRTERLEAVGRVAAGIAHDVNNLLQLAGLAAGHLRTVVTPSDDVKEDLHDLDRALTDVTQLNRDLLAFARGSATTPQPLSLDEAVTRFWPLLRRGFGPHYEFHLELHSMPWLANVDPTALQQVVSNLVLNARDAMPQGGQLDLVTTRRVLSWPRPAAFSELPAGEYLSLRVSDTGQGMDEQTAQRVFEPFFTTKGAHGTGLGLSTVFGLTRQAGGAIDLVTRPGQGTSFELLLPRHRAA
jgi:signal transduction histidine kinase